MSQPKLPFAKPWISRADQLQLLQQRGLIVNDASAAEEFLAHLNYYRFSGYCLGFETQRHVFVNGTTFEDVVAAYKFDLALRDLLTEALEIIEVDLRATVAYSFGQAHGAFGHTNPAIFFQRFQHQTWLDKIRDETTRSSELFVKHFERTYREYPDLPVWAATEVMSFGCLSKMLQGMKRADQKPIAGRYGVQPQVLAKLVHHFAYMRNLCAHHARVWDKVWAIKPTLPAGKDWCASLVPANDRLFATLLLIRKLLKRIDAASRFAAAWKDRVEQRLAKPPTARNVDRRMGLTDNWASHPVWK